MSGAVYCLDAFQGKLLAGINAQIALFAWQDTSMEMTDLTADNADAGAASGGSSSSSSSSSSTSSSSSADATGKGAVVAAGDSGGDGNAGGSDGGDDDSRDMHLVQETANHGHILAL